jgi:glycosyltransferase involved in cell wall biosynthesis
LRRREVNGIYKIQLYGRQTFYIMEKISAVIITYNAGKDLVRCIESVKSVADEIVVLDSFSTDDTVNIARQSGAVVFQQNFMGYKEQKNAALNLASNNFILSLDADEALSPELAKSIQAIKTKPRYSAFTMNRANFFCDRFIKHGLWYPDKKIRLFDKRIAYWGGMNPHDKIILNGKTKAKHLSGDLLHYCYYSEEELIKRNEELTTIAANSLYQHNAGQQRFKIFLSPAWRFLYGYFFKLGFLDGRYGFLIAQHTAKQGYLKYKKLNQLYKQQKSKETTNSS